MNLPASRVHLPCPASPWRNWAPCRWWVGLWLAWLVPPVLAADAASVVRFDQADYRQLQPAAPAAWQAVALPDTWGARGLPLAGRAHYRLTLPL